MCHLEVFMEIVKTTMELFPRGLSLNAHVILESFRQALLTHSAAC